MSDYGDDVRGNTLFVIDMLSKRLIRRINVGGHRGVHDLDFLPNSGERIVVTAQVSWQVIEVDITRGIVTGVVETRGGGSHTLALARDGRTLFTANEEATNVSRLDLLNRKFVSHLDVGAQPLGMALTHDGREVWVGTRDAGVVRVIDPETGARLAELPGFHAPDAIAISPDGRLAVITDLRSESIYIVDVASRRITATLRNAGRPHAVTIAPDSRTAFVTIRQDAVLVIDLTAKAITKRFAVQDWPDGVSWGPAQ